jgi:hypothetical protein
MEASRKILRILGLVVLLVNTAGTFAQAATTLVIDRSGMLTGAKNVLVGNSLYDVLFDDGNYSAIFSYRTNVIFNSAMAKSASQALLDTVFLDSSAGLFDSHPGLIRGCYYDYLCEVLTPLFPAVVTRVSPTGTPSISVWGARNYQLAYGSSGYADVDIDYVVSSDMFTLTSTGGASTGVWALWSPAAVVPLPATLPFFGGAISVLMILKRKKTYSKKMKC